MNKRMKKNKLFIISLFCFLGFSQWGCEKEEVEQSELTSSLINTISSSSIGNGQTGLVTDYFYNFENNIDASFYRFHPSILSYNYKRYFELFQNNPPLMSYKTFPDYLVALEPSDEAENTRRYYIDSLSVQDSIVPDSILITSAQFKNLESLEWDLDAEPSQQRYQLRNSNWIQSDTLIYYSDTFDVNTYRAVVDTPFIQAGILFVDSSEWKDTNYVFVAEQQTRFPATFVFTRQQLSSDSLIFQNNTDCNDNGEWDQNEIQIQDYNNDGKYQVLYEYTDQNNNGSYDPETDIIISDYNQDGIYGIVYEFEDRGNGLWDPAEVWYDIDGDSQYDLNEPYDDRNCNEKWDGAELFTDSNGNNIYDDTEEFFDEGNGLYDDIEGYTLKDIDGDGTMDKLLYTIQDKPANLLTDWADPENPIPLLEISLNDGLTDRWGNVYNNIIEEVEFVDYKQQYANNVDSIVTLYTHEKVGHIKTQNQTPEDYYITKSEWTTTANGGEDRHYNYHIFFEKNHINQMIYPSYFLPVGFYFRPSEIDDGFWHKTQIESEVLYYTSNGLIRDGEQVDTAYYDTTDIAVYYIEKSYNVERSQATVPAARKRYNSSGLGTYNCLFDNSEVSDPEKCPAVDTTFTDCFKVIRMLTMTMLGSGVQFGQRTVSYLAKGHGVIKSEVDVRWTEHPYNSDYTSNGIPDNSNQAWIGLNRLELASIKVKKQSNVFKSLVNPAKLIKLRDIKNHPDFNYDPFRVSTQSGIHTINFKDFGE